MEINERYIKISSKVPITKAIEMGGEAAVSIKYDTDLFQFWATCVKVEETDNQDGTKNVTYVLKYSGE